MNIKQNNNQSTGSHAPLHTQNLKDTISASPSSGKLEPHDYRGNTGFGCTGLQTLMPNDDFYRDADDHYHVDSDNLSE